MNSVELGKRIKEARIARKMTQSEVVGDFITRNMLSQIESGTATPSVKTLTYLAKVLQLPVNYLLPDEMEVMDDSENAVSADFDALTRMKSLYKQGEYRQAIEYAKNHSRDDSVIYDEANAVLARAYLALAKECADPKEAFSYAENAKKHADMGIYRCREIKAEALLLAGEIAEKL